MRFAEMVLGPNAFTPSSTQGPPAGDEGDRFYNLGTPGQSQVIRFGEEQDDLGVDARYGLVVRKMIALINRGFYDRAIRYSIDSLKELNEGKRSQVVEVLKLKALALILVGHFEQAEFSLRDAWFHFRNLDEGQSEGLDMPPSLLGLLLDKKVRHVVDHPKVRGGLRQTVSVYFDYILDEVEEGWA